VHEGDTGTDEVAVRYFTAEGMGITISMYQFLLDGCLHQSKIAGCRVQNRYQDNAVLCIAASL
jgi:hypothetical protein